MRVILDIALLVLQFLYSLWKTRQAQKNSADEKVRELREKQIELLDAIARRDSGRLSRIAFDRAARLRILIDGLPDINELKKQ